MTRLEIINHALLKVGLPLAAGLDDCDWNANFVFDAGAEQALRAHAWGFAQRLAVLERLAQAPAFGFSHAYRMPEDCIRVVEVRPGNDLRSPRARFICQGRQVLTNAAPCNARYTARALDPEIWPADFANAAACKIACEIAALSAEKTQLVPQLIQLYQLSLAEAMGADAREETSRVPLDESLYAIRGERR